MDLHKNYLQVAVLDGKEKVVRNSKQAIFYMQQFVQVIG
jgi:hypothetical protein